MRALALTALLSLLTPVSAGATVLYWDTWYDGAQVALQLGNCPGECDAVVFTPPTYPFTINYIYAIGGPANSTLNFDVRIMDAGTQIYPDYDAWLGGAEDVQIEIGNEQDGDWFEVDLTQLGTPAVVESGRVAVAICFRENNNPCQTWGLGSDGGPAVVPDGGLIYVLPGEMCFQGSCFGGSGDRSWATLSSFGTDRNWIIRASNYQWEPGNPTDDDDDDTTPTDDDDDDDDTTPTDDDTGDDDDDAVDDDTGSVDVKIDAITPDVVNEGDLSPFTVSGAGFHEDADLYLGNLRVMPIDIDSSDSIEGAFPEGLAEGYHNVCVENPDSSEDCLINGLHVIGVSSCESCSVSRGSARVSLALLAATLALLVWRRRQ
jgi:hypothetical protein